MNLPMIGSSNQTTASKYQISLTVQQNKELHPIERPRVNRFFDNLEERNVFIQMLETSIQQRREKIVHRKEISHPLFETFNIINNIFYF